MKQVFLSGQGKVSVLDAPVPGRLKNTILVRNRYSLISSGTEGAAVSRNSGVLGLYEKAVSSGDRVQQVWEMAKSAGLRQTLETVQNKLADSNPVGYSSAGTVVEVDDASMPFQPGDTVACMGTHYANHAEYVVVPRNLAARVPDGVPMEQSAFAALACIAMQGIRRLELTPGERVGVVGLGLIGQLTVRMLAGMGYRAYGIDLSAERVAMSKTVANTEAWTLDECDSVQRVLALTDGIGLDGVLICAASDSNAPVNLGFDLCRKSGRVSLVGDVGLKLQRAKMYAKELELRMSCSYGPGRYDPDYEIRGHDYGVNQVRWSEGRNLAHFLWMLQTASMNITDLVSERFAVDDAVAAYARVKQGDPAVLGVLLDYGEPPALPEAVKIAHAGTRSEVASIAPAVIKHTGSGPVCLGIIGAGSYVKAMHLPKLKTLGGEFWVRGIASRTGASAAAAARRYKVPLTASDYRVLLDDPSVEAVLIATRHATHARIALDALDAGKHVFIEKPMTTTVADADRIVAAADRQGLVVRVGFNRRFSPYLLALREAIGRSGVRMLYARANIGALANDWSNTTAEGGRLLGEGVHFFDLANWFMGGEPVAIAAVMAGPIKSTNPNASVLLGYADGSHASVLYTCIGDKRMGKEYFEAFGNGNTAHVDNFAGFKYRGGKVRTKLRRGDKGQRDCLREFAAAVRGQTFPVVGADARAGLAATRVALAVIDYARDRSR